MVNCNRMSTLTTFEEVTQTENRSITVVPRHGLQQGSMLIEPIYDSMTDSYKGIPFDWEEKRRQGIACATPNDTFKFDFPSGKRHVFDLNNTQIAQRWAWIKHHPKLCLNSDDVINNPECLAYVEDVEADQAKVMTIKKIKFQMETWVRELSSAHQADVCKLLGQNVTYMAPAVIEDYLIDICRGTKYGDIKAVKEDTKTKTKLFLIELASRKMITPFQKGYKFEDIILGLDLDTCIYWLNQQENREIVLQWKQKINMGFEGEAFSLEKVLEVEAKNKGGRPPLNKEASV